jgi:mercuric ion transport protein
MKLSEMTVAAVAAVLGAGGVTAGAACCVLPLALAGVGVGASQLAPLVPLHTPLSAIALLAVAAGWFFYIRRRRACAAGAHCAPPSKATPLLLVVASALVVLSAAWSFIEAPLMSRLGG